MYHVDESRTSCLLVCYLYFSSAPNYPTSETLEPLCLVAYVYALDYGDESLSERQQPHDMGGRVYLLEKIVRGQWRKFPHLCWTSLTVFD